ncbi:MAG: serine/threonine protein kinase [Myxococcales bacterium]|nr:serine/threonine protein kinase [Myxococcales bacterium]
MNDASAATQEPEACPSEGAFLDFIAGTMTAAERAAFESHIDTCAGCHALLAALAHDLDDDDPDADAPGSEAPISGDAPTLLPTGGSATDPDRRAAAGLVPARLGRYVVIEPLGAGGMGVVYAAYDPELDRKLAIKLLRAGAGGKEEQARLLREAQALARLAHVNVVSVFDVGALGSGVFVAMEFIRGATLRSWARERPRSWREVVDVYVQAGRGLEAAHRAGLVHRDFKPHNAMIGEDGVVKVLDFGLAHLGEPTLDLAAAREVIVAGEDGHLDRLDPAWRTRTGALLGTPAYMSPEQQLGDGVDARSDQFSFCVALYESLYGEHPFPCGSLAELIAAVRGGEIKPAPAGAKVPSWLREVVLRGLRPAAAERYPSMAELVSALGRDPERRRRRRRNILGLGTAIAAASFGLALFSADALDRCAGVDEALVGVWDRDRRGALEEALLATGSERAATTFEGAAARLDRYAEGWADARAATCQDHRRGLLSEALYTRGVACLERRRASLDALVDATLGADVDAGVVDRLVSAAAGLPAIAPCADPAYLSAEVEPPERAIADEVGALRGELVRARELEALGLYDRAIAASDEVLAQAERTGYRPLLAEAWLRRGSAQTFAHAGDPAEADASLTSALLAAVAGGDTRRATEARIKRLYVRAELEQAIDRAREDLPMIEAELERLGGDPRLRGRYLQNLGVLEFRAGAPEAARDAYLAALELPGAFADDDPERLLTEANLGFALTEMRDYDAAITRLRETWARGEAILGPAHPQVAGIAALLLIALQWSGRHAEARATLDRLEAIGAAGPAATHLAFTRHKQLGEIALKERALDAAEEHFNALRELAEERLGPAAPVVAEPLHGLARVHLARGEHDEAVALHRRALELRLAGLGPEHPWIAYSRAWLGDALLARGELDAALTEQRAARALAEASEGPRSLALLLAAEGEARALAARGDLDGAAEGLARVIALQAERLPAADRELADARRTLARLLVDLDRRGDAEVELRAAIAAYAAAGEPDDRALALARGELAALLVATGCADPGEVAALVAAAQRALLAAGAAFRPEHDALATLAAPSERLILHRGETG